MMKLKTTAIALIGVFLIMAGCLAIQSFAATRVESHSCHDTAPPDPNDGRSMERCCQSGTMTKSIALKFAAEPASVIYEAPADFTEHSLSFHQQLSYSPPTARRLATLSVLLI